MSIVTVIKNTEVMMTETKPYQSKNVLMKLNHTWQTGIMNNLKKIWWWRIPLTIAINFISSKDPDEEQVMYSKSDKIETMTSDKAGEVIKEVFESHLYVYQIELETSVKISDSFFDCLDLLHHKCNKIKSESQRIKHKFFWLDRKRKSNKSWIDWIMNY